MKFESTLVNGAERSRRKMPVEEIAQFHIMSLLFVDFTDFLNWLIKWTYFFKQKKRSQFYSSCVIN